ncbi:MAG: hypothetical protein ABI663_15160 [Chryseolinea sp.]
MKKNIIIVLLAVTSVLSLASAYYQKRIADMQTLLAYQNQIKVEKLHFELQKEIERLKNNCK